MNYKLIGLSLLGGLLLGGAGVGIAQNVAQKTPAFSQSRANLENERNTIGIVKQYEDGLVYVSTTSNPAQAQKSLTPQNQTPQNQAPKSQPNAPQNKGQGNGTPQNPQGQNPQGQNPQGQGQDPQSQLQDFMQRFFGNAPQGDMPQFFNGPQQQNPLPQDGAGSGFFINNAGDILTNYHVVDGADTITVRLNGNKKEYPAKVIGTAPDFDLALIRASGVPKSAIKPMVLGNSDAIVPGQKTIALGAPFGLDFSVTEGIVSAIGRLIPVGARDVPQKVIQTDAAINPGNSGGPLLDSAGQVIGINSQIISPATGFSGQGQFAGVGFAIPINTAKNLLPKLQAGKNLETPLVGVRYLDLSALDDATRKNLKLPEDGLLVQDVVPGSPAAKAGLRAGTSQVTVAGNPNPITLGGDIITAVNGKSVADEDLREVLLSKSYGDTLKLTVRRAGKDVPVTVNLFKFQANAQK